MLSVDRSSTVNLNDVATNVLTLGYNPDKFVSMPGIGISDFYGTNGKTRLESIIRKSIKTKIMELGAKNVFIASGGGIDSNLVLSITKDACDELGTKVSTVTIGYNTSTDEVEVAKNIASTLDIDCHVHYVDKPLGRLDKLIKLVNEPRYKLYQYDCMEYAKSKGCDLYMTGDGGDEMFLGYIFRYKQFLDILKKMADTFPTLNVYDRIRAYLSGHKRNWTQDQPEMFGNLLQFSWDVVYRRLMPYFENSLHPLDQIKMADYNGKLLHDFVYTNDVFFNHLKLKGFCPLLSDEVKHYALSQDASAQYDYGSNIGKLPLIQILREMYPKVWYHIPAEKTGFGIEISSLWKNEAREKCKGIFKVIKDGLIDEKWFGRAMEKADAGDPRYQSKLPSILALEIWYSQQINTYSK